MNNIRKKKITSCAIRMITIGFFIVDYCSNIVLTKIDITLLLLMTGPHVVYYAINGKT